MDKIPVYIGYDPREAVAYHVCCESIIARASAPVEIIPLALNLFKSFYRETHTDGSNQFIYSRFLVPFLQGYKGHAIFIDGDMTVKGDIAELWEMRDNLKGVQVVKHDYKTKHPKKYFGAVNEDYPRKNWSSVILWNCSYLPNSKLTPDFIALQTGAYLHRFQWLQDERIGDLPKEWNWLAGEYPENEKAKLIHHTIGTPCIEGFHNDDHARDWYTELAGALNVSGQSPRFLLDNSQSA